MTLEEQIQQLSQLSRPRQAAYDPRVEQFKQSAAGREFFSNAPMFGTMDMYNSPYFGSVGSGSMGRSMDQAFESWLDSQGLPKQYQAPTALTAEQQIDAQKRGTATDAIAANPIQQTGYAGTEVGGSPATANAAASGISSLPSGGANTTSIDPSQSTLSPNFAQYVYNMLGRGEGLANLPYQEYTGQRFAGPSELQRRAFGGIGALRNPEQFDVASRAYQAILGRTGGVGDYTPAQFNVLDASNPQTVQSFMNPYQQQVVDIQQRELQRQADKAAALRGAKFAQAGAFGGSRQAIENAEAERNLQQQMGDIQATGSQAAFNQAMQNLANQRMASLQGQQLGEQSRQFGANLGLGALNPALQAASGLTNVGTAGLGGLQNIYNQQLGAGSTQQQFMQQPLDFGYQQFQESLKYPYQQATFMQSLLQGMPIAARPYDSGSSGFMSALQGGIGGLGLYNLFTGRPGPFSGPAPAPAPAPVPG